jgi:hypothetical protein
MHGTGTIRVACTNNHKNPWKLLFDVTGPRGTALGEKHLALHATRGQLTKDLKRQTPLGSAPTNLQGEGDTSEIAKVDWLFARRGVPP